MSRAFLRDDPPDLRPTLNHRLPPRDDPGFEAATARALLEGARVSEVIAAEEATGFTWGEPRLKAHVEAILEEARHYRDDRLEQVAERFLRQLRKP
ncbi:MAG: hypothetical protein K2X99_02880 [Gemmatimonadaceae bacterium]|nr:hypothetical protein [Gemmatimonadaceae bacterium]